MIFLRTLFSSLRRRLSPRAEEPPIEPGDFIYHAPVTSFYEGHSDEVSRALVLAVDAGYLTVQESPESCSSPAGSWATAGGIAMLSRDSHVILRALRQLPQLPPGSPLGILFPYPPLDLSPGTGKEQAA